MAKTEVALQSSPRRQNRFLVMLLVGAALVSAAKDLGRLHELTSGLVGLAASLHEKVNAAGKSPTRPSCPQALAENDRSGQPFNWNGRVAPDQLVEMKDSNGGVDAAQAVGGDLNLAMLKTVVRSEPARVLVQVVPRATEAANEVLRSKETTSRRNTVEVLKSRSANQSATIRVRHNDGQLNFTLRLPARFELVSRMINDEVRAASLLSGRRSGRVCPLTTRHAALRLVNYRLIPGGYAQAKIFLGREINVGLLDANRAAAIEFETLAGTISLDLLKILKARLAAGALNDEALSESPRTVNGMIQRTMVAAPAAVEDSH